MNSSLVILASGDGTTFEYLCAAVEAQKLSAVVRGLVVDRPASQALERASRWGVPSKVISPSSYPESFEWDKALAEQVLSFNPDWVVLAGFLRKLGPYFLKTFGSKTINTHPSLLPKFGGKGMYGRRVHEAVLREGESKTGVTIHMVDEEYDRGEIIGQKEVVIEPGESVESLEARVKEIEKGFLVETLCHLIETKI